MMTSVISFFIASSPLELHALNEKYTVLHHMMSDAGVTMPEYRSLTAFSKEVGPLEFRKLNEIYTLLHQSMHAPGINTPEYQLLMQTIQKAKDTTSDMSFFLR